MASSMYGLTNVGLNDFSLLGQPQQDTARQVQKSFDASMGARIRNAKRYNIPTGGPMLAEFAGDSALEQARTSAGLLNYNQQLQHVIDESKHTPHGIAENVSQFLPLLGAGMQLSPYLFGRPSLKDMIGGNPDSLYQKGLIPWGYDKLKSAYTNFTNPYGDYGFNAADYGPPSPYDQGYYSGFYDPSSSFMPNYDFSNIDFGGYEGLY